MNNYIKITDVINTSLCVSAEDGQIVYNKVFPLLEKKERVFISFKGVDVITPIFLITAFGQLYKEFSHKQVCSQLVVTDMSESNFELFSTVLDNERLYFSNSSSFDRAWKEEMSE